ncbi:hypothetical protein MASR2M15_14320 [Anaerolineales bacterium]
MQKISLLLFFTFIYLPLHLLAQENETFTDPASGISYQVELVTPALFPVAMAFTDDGRIFYTEKNTGRVRLIRADGTQALEPVLTLATSSLQERGMLGIALDPDYETNGYIWIYHTAEGTAKDYPSNRLIRFTEVDGIGSDPQIMLDMPITNGQLLHNGGNMRFDENGLLYLSVGDYGDASNSQNMDVPQGKIHRFAIEDDALIPAEGNPFEGSSIYALGFRNPYDFAIDPINGQIITSENGLWCDDEINLVLPRFNYGFSEDYECIGLDLIPGLTLYMPPMLSYTPTIGPSGLDIYSGEAFAEWTGDVFFCDWNFGELHHLKLDEARSAVLSETILELPAGVDCKIDVAVSPDGLIYFATVGSDSGGIYRISPAP